MRKLALILLVILMGAYVAFAEPRTCKVLYLIPFESNDYESPSVKECEDMDKVRSYQLMGFWNGAQMAIEKMGREDNIHFEVVVRDISNNEAKLRRVMEDSELMAGVDLVVGPFFGKLFSVAAEYAKRYGIPIVNPFTSRQDFLANNEYVYKLIPSLEARPAMVAFLAQQRNAFPVILFADSASKNKEQQAYCRYFDRNHIDYKVIPHASDVVAALRKGSPQLVVTFYDNPAQSLIISRSLIYSDKTDNLMFVVPETWLESNTYDIEYYTKLNLHFFSDYYIDYDAEATKTFIYEYTQRYGTPPTLQNFAFQGYDITRYFVDLVINDLDHDRVKVTPTAFPLSFDKLPSGGYENVNVQFLEVKDNEIVPSIY
jgi:ABC-type branched-subunit amino acid transport system substrate-binding protein